MNLFTQVFLRPFSYLTISHKQKLIVDWLFPTVLTALSLAIIFAAKHQGALQILGESGLINKINTFVQVLPGFYIAALAAIATFNKPEMDLTMSNPPTMKIFSNGQWATIDLTRRRFLSSMFAFLSASSVLLILLSIGIQLLSPFLVSLLPKSETKACITYAFLALYLMIFWQIIVTTLWGLFYLGEKSHNSSI